MSVLLTMQVGPVDWGKFKAATEWGYSQKPQGLISGKIYRAEGDQSRVLVIEEWESHDAWHHYADDVGEEFQDRAGTASLEWQDTIWVLSDAPQAP